MHSSRLFLGQVAIVSGPQRRRLSPQSGHRLANDVLQPRQLRPLQLLLTLTPYPHALAIAQPHGVEHLLRGAEDAPPHGLDELVALRDLFVVQRVEQVVQRVVLRDLLHLLLVPMPHAPPPPPLKVLVRVHSTATQHRQRAHRRRHLHARAQRPNRHRHRLHSPEARRHRRAKQRGQDASRPLRARHACHVVLQRVHHA